MSGHGPWTCTAAWCLTLSRIRKVSCSAVENVESKVKK